MAAIGPGDPEYDRVMSEAKALFEAATAQSAAKRGRPRKASPAASAAPAVAADDAADLEGIDDIDDAAPPGADAAEDDEG